MSLKLANKSDCRNLIPGILLALLIMMGISASSRAESILPLEDYLSQVRQHNDNYRGWALARQAALERERSKDLITSPSAFANARFSRDEKLPTFPVFSYDRYDTRNYSAGVQGRSRFGLAAKLSYEMDYTDYVGVSDPAFARVPLSFYDARPVLELTQSLWQNAGGRATRASIDAAEAESRAAARSAEAQMRLILSDAESAYSQLQVAREAVEVQESALRSAQAIYDYSSRQTRRNLADEADSLQSEALLESRRLELKIAKDDERAALRRLNGLRTSPSETTADALTPLDWNALTVSAWPTSGRRAEVLAAEEEERLAAANALLHADQRLPVLEAYGSYALNGRDSGFNGALSDSYSANRPTATAGLRFSVPLDFGAVASTRRGLQRDAAATRLRLAQSLADEQVELRDLRESLADARERLRLSRVIEAAQKRKLEYEGARLKKGRTSTYQVLLFEQDYSQSELNRVRSARDVLTAVARYRLYVETSSESRP